MQWRRHTVCWVLSVESLSQETGPALFRGQRDDDDGCWWIGSRFFASVKEQQSFLSTVKGLKSSVRTKGWENRVQRLYPQAGLIKKKVSTVNKPLGGSHNPILNEIIVSTPTQGAKSCFLDVSKPLFEIPPWECSGLRGNSALNSSIIITPTLPPGWSSTNRQGRHQESQNHPWKLNVKTPTPYK